MNERQREYFRQKLLDWKDDILKEAKETLQHLQDENQNHPDLADRASSETEVLIASEKFGTARSRNDWVSLISMLDWVALFSCNSLGEPVAMMTPLSMIATRSQSRSASSM